MIPSLPEELLEKAFAQGLDERQATHQVVLEGILRRLAQTPNAKDFVLRGGLLTRHWVGKAARATQDVDLVGDFDFDIQETGNRFRPVLTQPIDDGIVIDPNFFLYKGIWLQSEFPGVRLSIRTGWGIPREVITIDVGFRDPLVPEPQWIDYPTLMGDSIRVRTVRLETMVAWKLHGLADFGIHWRPKDLADLWLITRSMQLANEDWIPAKEAAFRSRGMDPDQGRTVFDAEYWQTKSARVRWSDFRTETNLDIPESLSEVLQEVKQRIQDL
jgi:hypothetical protein